MESTAGGGTLTLQGANTFSGALNLYGGTVNFSSLGNLGTGSAINFNGGTLQWASSTSTDISSSMVTIGSSGATLDINGNNVTLANSIGNGGSGALTVVSTAGGGTLTLEGSNTFGGAMNLKGGTVNFSSLGNLGTSSAINFGGGALQWAANTSTDISSRTVTINSGGATFDINGNNVTLNSAIGNGGSGGLTLVNRGSPAT